MTVKEFSQTNSVILFYTTIILIVVALVLGFMSFSHKDQGRIGPENMQGNPQGMVQDNANMPIPDSQE